MVSCEAPVHVGPRMTNPLRTLSMRRATTHSESALVPRCERRMAPSSRAACARGVAVSVGLLRAERASALRLVQGDAVYRPGRAADRFSERDAVRHGSRPRDDIGVVHPVAVAVEGAVVDYDGGVTR